jgi:hypothetical protein
MKVTVYWDIKPCTLVVDRRFRGACCLNHQICRADFLTNFLVAFEPCRVVDL